MMDWRNRKAAAVAIAIAIAIPAEGLRKYTYTDPPGILTACYGHTGPDVKRGNRYTLAECKALLDTDMLNAMLAVERCVPGLPVNVLAAFSDAVYNIGPRIACDTKRSTAARLLAAGDLHDACMQLPRWNKAFVGGFSVPLPGLTIRRANDMHICLTQEWIR